jgi:hypothetical protein
MRADTPLFRDKTPSTSMDIDIEQPQPRAGFRCGAGRTPAAVRTYHEGRNQVVMSTPSQQGGMAIQGLQHASPPSLMMPQGGHATHGLQPGPQPLVNPQVAQGGLPVQQPVQPVQQQPVVRRRQLRAQRVVNNVRFPTADALAAGALPAPPGGATPDMEYRPFPGGHTGMTASKWYHGHPVVSDSMPHWQCAYCKCSMSGANPTRKI